MNYRIYLGLILGVIATSELYALGIRIPDQDAYAIGRGNAFVATADNPAAIYYNPAGITQRRGQQVSLGIYGILLGSDYSSSSGAHAETKKKPQALPQVYYTFSPTNQPLAYGVGIYSPYGLSIEWPDRTPFRTEALKGKMEYLTFNPEVAWRILPTLSIAAGPTVNYAKTELRRGIVAPGDWFQFKGDDLDVGYHLGLLWHPLAQHVFGVSYYSATTMNFDGHSEIHSVVPAIPSGRQAAQARFRFPQTIVAGWSYRPTPAWNLEFDVDWTDWETLNTVLLKESSGQQIPLPFNWRSSFMYKWGATHFFKNGYHASLGYIYSENSVPDRSFSPLVPDSNRHVFSVGVGHQYRKLRWDAAYQLAYGPWRSVSNDQDPLVNGRYRFISHALTLSVGYAF